MRGRMFNQYEKANLSDFFNIENSDILQRAKIFNQYAEYTRKIKHDYYRRISLDGSAPTIEIIDSHNGKPRK